MLEENLQFLRLCLFIQTYDNLQQVGNVFTIIYHTIDIHRQAMWMSDILIEWCQLMFYNFWGSIQQKDAVCIGIHIVEIRRS